MRKYLIPAAILVAIGIAVLFFALSGSEAKQSAPLTASHHSESTVWGSLPSYSPTTSTTTAAVSGKTTKAPVSSPKAQGSFRSTTSTSEVPPPLTPEQEAKIQAGLEESDADQDEHMPQDYDLPSETSTTIEFVETPL